MAGAPGPAGGAEPGPLRAIDVPIEDLPRVDEHAVVVEAPQEAAWEALLPALRQGFGGPVARRVAAGLGCRETETAGDPLHPGATLPGFVVARVVPPTLYALLGAHRFARYALVFSIDRLGGGRSIVRAETRAEFPGVSGRAYRALVIGTRGHVLVVRRLLRAVKRRAER
ncbi:MAG TPA: hypothetical protein VK919_04245 [Solirubrobacterales bacterium]|nr:hypothetical protein [Solirubrobacterales bacterium]